MVVILVGVCLVGMKTLSGTFVYITLVGVTFVDVTLEYVI